MKVLKEDFTKELQDVAEKILNECQEMVHGVLIESPEIKYQDATNAFFFAKLAQLQMQIDILTDKTKSDSL